MLDDVLPGDVGADFRKDERKARNGKTLLTTGLE